jgi:hypothetical protein
MISLFSSGFHFFFVCSCKATVNYFMGVVHHEFEIQMLLLVLINHVPSSQLQLEHRCLRNVRGGGRGFVCHAKQVP